jgi:hypothetical protein
MIRIFQMSPDTAIEIFVLAADHDRASELFAQHLLAHSGVPGGVVFRELELQDLNEPANDAVYEAFDYGEGLVIWDADEHWYFVPPPGDRDEPLNEE